MRISNEKRLIYGIKRDIKAFMRIERLNHKSTSNRTGVSMQGLNSRSSHPNGMAQRRRRKKYKLKPGHPTDQELIASYLANEGKVTQCPPGRAIGSMQSQCFGLE